METATTIDAFALEHRKEHQASLLEKAEGQQRATTSAAATKWEQKYTTMEKDDEKNHSGEMVLRRKWLQDLCEGEHVLAKSSELKKKKLGFLGPYEVKKVHRKGEPLVVVSIDIKSIGVLPGYVRPTSRKAVDLKLVKPWTPRKTDEELLAGHPLAAPNADNTAETVDTTNPRPRTTLPSTKPPGYDISATALDRAAREYLGAPVGSQARPILPAGVEISPTWPPSVPLGPLPVPSALGFSDVAALTAATPLGSVAVAARIKSATRNTRGGCRVELEGATGHRISWNVYDKATAVALSRYRGGFIYIQGAGIKNWRGGLFLAVPEKSAAWIVHLEPANSHDILLQAGASELGEHCKTSKSRPKIAGPQTLQLDEKKPKRAAPMKRGPLRVPPTAAEKGAKRRKIG